MNLCKRCIQYETLRGDGRYGTHRRSAPCAVLPRRADYVSCEPQYRRARRPLPGQPLAFLQRPGRTFVDASSSSENAATPSVQPVALSSAPPTEWSRKRSLRILYLEDNFADVELVRHELEKAGFGFALRHVATPEAYTNA